MVKGAQKLVKLLISKEVETQLRRDRVLELTSKGLTQQEIADRLKYSQQTISNDIIYLRKEARENLQQHAQELPYHYEQALSNLRSVIKEAWALAEQTKDERLKASLFTIIKDVTESMLEVLSAGDLIEKEVTAAELAAKKAEEELQEITEVQHYNNSNQKQVARRRVIH
jgi:transcriptional regulator with XRE-family HTH domain